MFNTDIHFKKGVSGRDDETKWYREAHRVLDQEDPIVETVRARLKDRSDEGIEKYGCTMMREDVTTVQWIDHAIEELLDGAVYLERLKYDILKKDNS